MAPRRTRRRIELMEDAIEQILLRVSPEEPAHLIRASLACKLWRRIVSDPAFDRRYREFHRVPPLLGFLHNQSYIRGDLTPCFTSTTAAASPIPQPQPPVDCYSRALDCRHGRALFRVRTSDLVVWNPVTGDSSRLPRHRIHSSKYGSSAVLCAMDSCNHLDCHRNPFLVVSVCSHVSASDYEADYGYGLAWACVYSSEAKAWGPTASAYIGLDCVVDSSKNGALVGREIYFVLLGERKLLRFDLDKKYLSTINSPGIHPWADALMVTEDRSLGFAAVRNSRVYLWSRNVDLEGAATWVQYRVIELHKLHPAVDSGRPTSVVGFADGVGVIFVRTDDGVFALDLKLGLKRKIIDYMDNYTIFPFMSFYTPDCASRKLRPPAEITYRPPS